MIRDIIYDPQFVAAKRRLDPFTDLVQPWFTHPALDVIEKWELRGKNVLEWGGGFSTAWWANRVGPEGRVFTIEHSMYEGDVERDSWFAWLSALQARTPNVYLRRADTEEYLVLPAGRWDIVVVDGEPCHLRTDCLLLALTLPRPLTIIVDNWQQDFVYIDHDAEQAMEPFEGEFFTQADHTDHEGKPWRTAIWRLS